MKKLSIIIVLIIALTAIGAVLLQAQDKKESSAITNVDAKLGTGIQDKMITGEAESFPKDSQVYVWFKVSGAASQEITVTWKTGDYSKTFTLTIGGSPWRAWAQKNLRQAGDWTVSLSDAQGNILKELKFKVE